MDYLWDVREESMMFPKILVEATGSMEIPFT